MEETRKFNESSNKKFNVFSSVYAQIPHFSCTNHFLDQKMQNDINRFVFSKEYNIKPYNGSYGDLPSTWISKVNIISEALNHIKKKAEEKQMRGK